MTATNAIWCDEFLLAYAQAVVGGIVDIPRFLSAYKVDVNLVPTVTFAVINPDTSIQVDVSTMWAYTLLSSHIVQATLTLNFVFPPATAGQIYYGVCLFTSVPELAWFSPFGQPFAVPTGGTVLQLVLTLSFGDCSSNP